jgi:hypothetical protein
VCKRNGLGPSRSLMFSGEFGPVPHLFKYHLSLNCYRDGMKWKSHKAIARVISKEMGLPYDLEIALCDGSIEPDKRPDTLLRIGKNGKGYIVRAPHHHPHIGTVMAHAWMARRAYLQGNNYWAVKSLGRALHYVQDKSVHTGFMFLAHDSREEAIAKIDPPLRAVVMGFEMAVSSPDFVKKCITRVRPRRNAKDAMFEATLYSSAIFASVFTSPKTTENFLEDYRKARRRRRLRWLNAIGTVAFSFLIAIILDQPIVALLGVALATAIVVIDPHYRWLRAEAEWFGVR